MLADRSLTFAGERNAMRMNLFSGMVSIWESEWNVAERKNRRLKFRIKKGIPRALPYVEHATRDDLRSCVRSGIAEHIAAAQSNEENAHRALHSNE